MTHDASLRLSRAIAFNDRQFKFELNEIIVTEYIQYPPLKVCQIREKVRLIHNNQCHLSKKIKTKPVKKN
jgi:hypothetical protein